MPIYCPEGLFSGSTSDTCAVVCRYYNDDANCCAHPDLFPEDDENPY